ncbi:MAG: hypothetical protein O6931_00640 [Gammaproteobacteria bacterium]|nr:hypothetical protein [Gammaproteobacteria bacterium]
MNHLQKHSLQLLGRPELRRGSAQRIVAARRRVAITASDLKGVSRQN